MSALEVTIVPQLSDNYVFLLRCAETGDAAIVDCPDASGMIAKCEELGITPTKILNTHHHPDHIYGVPVLLMNLWLLGRRGSFPIYGPRKALGIIQKMMDLYEWKAWPEFLRVHRPGRRRNRWR